MRYISRYKLKIRLIMIICLYSLFFEGIITVNAAKEKAEFNYDTLAFTLKNIKEHIIPIDMDGDGLKDLLCSNESIISVYFQKKENDSAEAFNFKNPEISIEFHGDSVGWDVDYPAAKYSNDTDTGKRLVAVVDGKSVMAWSIRDRTLSTPEILLENLPGILPKGTFPLRFIRDVNEDGLTDIILPGSGKLHIYLQDKKGTYKGNIYINTHMGISGALTASSNIEQKVGQSITIPAMTIRDVNNDGRNDVISKVDKITEVFLGKTDGTFPDDPSYRIDLEKMTTPPKEFNFDSLDFSNIFSAIPIEPQQYLQDLDGDKIEDLILLDNGKITIHSGTSTGMDLERPRQILKSSGNVLFAFAAVTQDKDKNKSTKEAITTFDNENQDETKPKDLILIRLQDISVGDIFTWFAFSKNIDIEFFIYKNQGKIFAKRPDRKITMTIKLPSALKLISYVNDMKYSEKDSPNIKIIRANISKTQTSKDRLVLRNNTIQGFHIEDDNKIDLLSDGQFTGEQNIFDHLDFITKEDHITLDIDEMMENLPELGNFGLLAIKDKEPEFTIDIEPYLSNTIKEKASDEQSISAVDLNGDNMDDIFLFTDRDDTSVAGTLFLSR